MESVFRISNCAEDSKVKFATCTLLDGALTWWNSYAHSVSIDTAYLLPWEDLKKMLTEEYCPSEELQRLEEEFWNLTVQGTDIIGYTTRFQQPALLCPAMVDPEHKRIQRYIRGLPENIQGNVTSSKPTTIQSAIRLAHQLMAMVVNRKALASPASNSNKRKWTDNQNQTDKRSATTKTYATNSDDSRSYKGSKPYCTKCSLHHDGTCPCTKCKRFGHLAKDCRTVTPATDTTTPKTCYECNGIGHFKKDCPKLKNKNTAPSRVYLINAERDSQDLNAN